METLVVEIRHHPFEFRLMLLSMGNGNFKLGHQCLQFASSFIDRFDFVV